MIILPKKRIVQPQQPVGIDWSNPLSKGLTLALTGSNLGFNHVTGKRLTVTPGGSGYTQSFVGNNKTIHTASGGWIDFDLDLEPDWSVNSGINSVFILSRVNSVDTPWGGIFCKNGTGTDGQFGSQRSGWTDVLAAQTSATQADPVSGSSVSGLSTLNTQVFQSSPNVNSGLVQAYKDGVFYGDTSPTTVTMASGSGLFGLGRERASNTSYTSSLDVALVLRFNRFLSDNEIYRLHQAPWPIFAPQKRRLLIKPAAASGSTGTSATTNANDTSTASGKTTIVGSSATTNAADTSTASGKTTIVGTSTTTNANDTSTASGKTTIVGSSTTTNANDTCTASGSVGNAIVGTSATTNANDTSTASGKTTIVGTSTTTNANDTSSGAGKTTIVGTSATTNANDTSTASGIAGAVSGTSNTTNANDTSTARGVSGNPVIGTSGGYYDVYTGRKKDKLPPRVLKKRLHKEEEKKSEILEIVDENPGKLKFYAKDLREIQKKIDALKEQIEGKKSEIQSSNDQATIKQSRRYEMIVRMLLLS